MRALWSLVVDGLLSGLICLGWGGGGLIRQGYADDICILRMGHFSGTVANLVQGVLQWLEKRYGLKGLSVNAWEFRPGGFGT